MDYKKDYLPLVKERVKETRYIHTLGVIDEALMLANKYGVNPDKARIAASLHDYTKYLDKKTESKIIIKYYGKDIYDRYPRSIYHGLTAAILSKEELGIDDEDIINAIRYHSIGRCNMSTLEKIIYIADFTEPNRGLELSKKAHDIAMNNLDEGLEFIMRNTIDYLKEENRVIPKETYDAYEYIKEHLNE